MLVVIVLLVFLVMQLAFWFAFHGDIRGFTGLIHTLVMGTLVAGLALELAGRLVGTVAQRHHLAARDTTGIGAVDEGDGEQ